MEVSPESRELIIQPKTINSTSSGDPTIICPQIRNESLILMMTETGERSVNLDEINLATALDAMVDRVDATLYQPGDEFPLVADREIGE